MKAENRIGQFLRARRALLLPADVGLSDVGRRRVPGLRREELALLAGVSVDYYVRLEQGREQHPSEQVLDALARALGLDDDATAHLHQLARPAAHRRRATRLPERVSPSLQRLLDRWSQTPAHVVGSRMDVLAHNALAAALLPGLTIGSNLLRNVFLDLASADFIVDWERCARDLVGNLRATAGPDLDDPRLNELVGELSLKSERFRRLWARHEIHQKTGGAKRFNHPIVGELELDEESFAVNAAPGQLLTVFHAAPATRSEQALTLLATLAANDPPTDTSAKPRATSSPTTRTPPLP
ncbi:MAG: helix-turn-helix transcriptional regulator [Actinobacteria bacterium]|nr:helix-turn-helix transcriptional regulator [Actinomycetota bacterium]